MESKKRKRPNWSSDEMAVLKDLATEHATILDKKYDNMTSKETKRKIWDDISKKVSMQGKFERSPNACRKRWQNQKSAAISSVRTWAKETRQTGNY